MVDLTRYCEIYDKIQKLQKELKQELILSGFDEELKRLREAGDLDGLALLGSRMPETSHKRLLYEAMVTVEENRHE